jgi:hypothetical protein
VGGKGAGLTLRGPQDEGEKSEGRALPETARSLTAGSPVALSSGRGFLPLDRAHRELQAHVKAAAWSWLAINHSRRLREFPYQRSKQRFFAGLPLSLGHHPSAVWTDVTGERSFGSMRFLGCCQVYRDNQGDAFLNSPVEKHSTKIRRWSRVVH